MLIYRFIIKSERDREREDGVKPCLENLLRNSEMKN